MSSLWVDDYSTLYRELYNGNATAKIVERMNVNLMITYDNIPLINTILLSAMIYSKKDYKKLLRLLRTRYWEDVECDTAFVSVLHIKKKQRVIRINDRSLGGRMPLKGMTTSSLYNYLAGNPTLVIRSINTLDGRPLMVKRLISKIVDTTVYNLRQFKQVATSGKVLKGLEEKKDDMDDQIVCRICLTEPKCVVLIPCKHFVSCMICVGDLERCPLCRTDIEEKMKIYT